MDRPPLMLSCLLLAGLAACAPAPESGIRVPATSTDADRAAAATPSSPAAAIAPMPDTPTTSAAADGQWFLQESEPPRAVWGVPASEGMLSLSCDREGLQLVLERQAIGVAEDVRLASIEADGTRMDYPAERVDTALAPMLRTRIALDAPIVDRMLIASRVAVTAGTDTVATVSPGPFLRAVIDGCRRGVPE